MRVWVDQVECIGNGSCQDACPEVFKVVGKLAYIIGDDGNLLPDGEDGILTVQIDLEEYVIEAAEGCPTDCIYIEE